MHATDTITTLQQVRETFDAFADDPPPELAEPERQAWFVAAEIFGCASPVSPVAAYRELTHLAVAARNHRKRPIYRYAANLINDVCEAIDGQPLT